MPSGIKKVAKVDAATLTVRRENGGKIIVRGSCFEGEQAVALPDQTVEMRMEDGSIVVLIRTKPKVRALAEFFSEMDLEEMSCDEVARRILAHLDIQFTESK